jgi:general bacterial porin, GBP family
MKKSLIALTVLSTIAGSVAAQSSVTVYGRMDQGYQNVELTNGEGETTKAKSTGLDGGVGGSRLGFRGTEDLGGGLKANFVLEFGVDNNENVGANTTRLGFAEIASPSTGTARVGRQVSPVKAVLDGFRPSGNNTNFRAGELFQSGGYMNADQRVSNGIAYITPTFSGFSAQVQMSEVNQSTAEGTSTNAATNAALNSGAGQDKGLGYSINYSAGKIAASYARFELTDKTVDGNSGDDVQTFAASYDFGAAKLFALHTLREVDAVGVKTFDGKLTTLGLTAPVGKWALSAEYSDGSDKAIDGETAGNDAQGYKVRAMYNLSKRTGVYAQMGESKLKSKDADTGTTKVEGYNIGLVHTF